MVVHSKEKTRNGFQLQNESDDYVWKNSHVYVRGTAKGQRFPTGHGFQGKKHHRKVKRGNEKNRVKNHYMKGNVKEAKK